MDMRERIRQEARLIMLKALSKQVNETLHSGLLDTELRFFGVTEDRAWIHNELRWLEAHGAVTLIEAGTVLVATITETGLRHLRREIAIEGIKRPSSVGA